jgi:hypothetical protein
MKSKSNKRTPAAKKAPRSRNRSLEETYRKIFTVAPPAGPIKNILSIYKSVPSITTYGLYERPV